MSKPTTPLVIGLCNDDVFRGAIIALKLWRSEGRYRGDWRDYRDSALAWLKLAVERLEEVQ